MVQGSAHAHGVCVLVLEYLLFYDLGYWMGWVCIWEGRRRMNLFYALLGFNGTGLGYLDFGIWPGVFLYLVFIFHIH